MAKTFVERLNEIVRLWEYEDEEQGDVKGETSSFRKIEVVHVKELDDAEVVLRILRSQEPVIVDIEKVADEDKQAVLDFICGMAYALNGTMEWVRNNVFVITPAGVEVDDDSIWYSLYR